ncbi:uncharacterized protein LOC123307080 [Coccinella septempunctata]|uniref:uncharacterized protein LOC123307080 n=1 Tax=Coccinella septempunctata TaxID=41139 RepID=UPI001D086339|nr:uncharacterized protein LOC123307080 [Coccinella septempunctata]
MSEYDIICLTETWLDDNILDSEVLNNSYKVYRRDRRSGSSLKSRGGGVLVAVSNNLTSFSESSWCSEAEDIWVTIVPDRGSKARVHIGCAYIPPRDMVALTSFTSSLCDIVNNNNCNDTFVICGDFNLPEIKWNMNPLNSFCIPSNARDPCSASFVDAISLSGLNQFNSFVNVSGNTLDLVLNNNFNITDFQLSEFPLVPEDPSHNTLQFNINVPVQHKKCLGNSRNRNFNRADFGAINEALGAIDWTRELSYQDLDTAVDRFYEILDDIFDSSVPSYPKYCRKYPTWYSLASIKTIREKKKFHKRWKMYANSLDYATFRLLRARAGHLISEDYKKYLASVEGSIVDDPKFFWRYVGNKKGSPCLPDSVGTPSGVSTNPQEICNKFSDYFASVFLPSSAITYNEPSEGVPLHLSNLNIERDHIRTKITSMRNGSPGPDGIPSSFLKNCCDLIFEPLFILFNKSLKDGCFPYKWKVSSITPIFKSGNKNLVENYRPISKLCAIDLKRFISHLVYLRGPT